ASTVKPSARLVPSGAGVAVVTATPAPDTVTLAGETPASPVPVTVTPRGSPVVARSGGDTSATTGPPTAFTVKLTATVPPAVVSARMRSPGAADASIVRRTPTSRSFDDCTVATRPGSPKTATVAPASALPSTVASTAVPTTPEAGKIPRAAGAHAARASAGSARSASASARRRAWGNAARAVTAASP